MRRRAPSIRIGDFRRLIEAVICDASGVRLAAPVAAEVINLADLAAVKAAVSAYLNGAAIALNAPAPDTNA